MMTPKMTYDGGYTYDNYTLDLVSLSLQCAKLDEYITLTDDGTQNPVLFMLAWETLTQLKDLAARFTLAGEAWGKDCALLFDLRRGDNPAPECGLVDYPDAPQAHGGTTDAKG